MVGDSLCKSTKHFWKIRKCLSPAAAKAVFPCGRGGVEDLKSELFVVNSITWLAIRGTRHFVKCRLGLVCTVRTG